MDRQDVRYKKNKGSFTPSIALLLIFTITISAVLTDYARAFSAKPIIEKQVVSAIDTALMSYDKTLFDEFMIYGYDTNDAIEDKVLQTLQLFENTGDNRMYHYEIENISISTNDASLSDEAMLKHLIIENHSQAFVIDQAVGWLERIEMFKSLDKLSEVVSEHAEMLEGIQTLEKYYKIVKEGYQDLLEFKDLLDQIDISGKASDLENKREELEEISDEIKELKKDKKKSIGEKFFGIAKRIRRLYKKKKSIQEDISDIEKSLGELVDAAEKVDAYIENLKLFSEKLNVVLEDVGKYSNKLKNLVSESDNKFLKESLTSLSNQTNKVVEKLDGYNTIFSKNITSLNELSQKVSEFTESIKNILDEKDSESSISQTVLENIVNDLMPVTFDYFEREEAEDSSGIDTLWNMLFNNVLESAGYTYGQIDDSVYASLPSRTYNASDEDAYKFKENNQHNKAKQLTKTLSESSNLLTRMIKSLSYKGDEFLQRMVLADYVVTTFANQTDTTNGDHDTPLKGAETEYILHGHSNGNLNVALTDGQIFAIRLALNAISIAAFKQAEIDSISASIAAVTGELAFPIVYALILIAWSAAESYTDLSTLKKGGDITFFKFEKDITCDFMKLFNERSFDASSFAPSEVTKSDDISKLDYNEHLFLLLLFQGEDEQLKRIMDLIAISASQTDKSFGDYKIGITVDVTYTIKSWFGLPTKTFSCQIDRGY